MELENIAIIMVGTTHPGNIGAAARAMHNMCISNLTLVDPKCPVGEIAFARSSGAHSILESCKKVQTLQQAVDHCNLVIGTSARLRTLPWPELNPEQMALKIKQMDDASQVAIVFGREHSGLTNEELKLCNYTVGIPTNPDFSSLNVASAIQVLCYEIYKNLLQEDKTGSVIKQDPVATSMELNGYFKHLEQVLIRTEFLDPKNPGHLLQRLRRLYQRAEPSISEVKILRGILSAVEKYKS